MLRTAVRFLSSLPPHRIIKMPALSPTMMTGNLAAWRKKEGDLISPGEVLAEVETDKATVDFESQDDGYLAKIIVPGGSPDIKVGQPVGVLVEDASSVAAFKNFVPEASAAPAAPAAPKPAPVAAKPAPAAPKAAPAPTPAPTPAPAPAPALAPAPAATAAPLP